MNIKTFEHKGMEYYEEHPEEITIDETNNFYCKLPGGMSRRFTDSLDVVLEEEYKGSSNLAYYTAIRQKQTYRQFFQEIDDSIVSVGLSLEEIKSANERILDLGRQAGKNGNDLCNLSPEVVELYSKKEKLRTSLIKSTLPLYHYLRGKGYGHYDLIA